VIRGLSYLSGALGDGLNLIGIVALGPLFHFFNEVILVLDGPYFSLDHLELLWRGFF